MSHPIRATAGVGTAPPRALLPPRSVEIGTATYADVHWLIVHNLEARHFVARHAPGPLIFRLRQDRQPDGERWPDAKPRDLVIFVEGVRPSKGDERARCGLPDGAFIVEKGTAHVEAARED